MLVPVGAAGTRRAAALIPEVLAAPARTAHTFDASDRVLAHPELARTTDPALRCESGWLCDLGWLWPSAALCVSDGAGEWTCAADRPWIGTGKLVCPSAGSDPDAAPVLVVSCHFPFAFDELTLVLFAYSGVMVGIVVVFACVLLFMCYTSGMLAHASRGAPQRGDPRLTIYNRGK